MATTTKKTNKSGQVFYEIRAHVSRGRPTLTKRWYPPEGWSARAIERELAKVAAEFDRQARAGEVLSLQERKAKAGREAEEAARIQTLRQYGEQVFMPAKTITVSEHTRDSFQSILDLHVYPALGSMKLPEITSANITALLLSKQKDGYSHASTVKMYTVLNLIFKMAYLSDVITRNPMDKVQRPKPRKEEIKGGEVEAFTAEELRYIISCLEREPLKWRALIRLLIDTGIRVGECCGLQWEDVDFTTNTITVAHTLGYTKAKGIYLDTPKSGKARTIDVDPAIMAMLKRYHIEQSSKALSRFVFTQEGSADPMHPQSPRRYLSNFGKRYGVEDLHPHKLRHSFASVAITSGADIASVSEKLGHSDKAVTLRMYTHADQESMKRASNIFRDAVKNA